MQPNVIQKSVHRMFSWSKVAATQVCLQVYETPLCIGESLTNFSLIPRIPYSCNSNVFSVARELHRFPSVLYVLVYSTVIMSLLSLWLFWFCCLYSKEACGCVYPQRLCFELRGLPPLSLIIAFGSVPWQEMRDLFYLAWTTLFLPDYWCYFTLNNMTLCSQPAQGQSLRVIDTFKSRGGDYNQRGGVARIGGEKKKDWCES